MVLARRFRLSAGRTTSTCIHGHRAEIIKIIWLKLHEAHGHRHRHALNHHIAMKDIVHVTSVCRVVTVHRYNKSPLQLHDECCILIYHCYILEDQRCGPVRCI